MKLSNRSLLGVKTTKDSMDADRARKKTRAGFHHSDLVLSVAIALKVESMSDSCPPHHP
jgi:hypothetical protein